MKIKFYDNSYDRDMISHQDNQQEEKTFIRDLWNVVLVSCQYYAE